MNTEQGQRMAGALKAVAKMHSDTSKLLLDCDKYIGQSRRMIFGNYATRDLTWNVSAPYWMAYHVCRYYEARPSLVDSIGVTFFSTMREFEPLLKVARIEYHPAASCEFWDLWSLFFESLDKRELGTVLHCVDTLKGRIAQADLIAVPLFSISRIEDVTALLERVTAAQPEAHGAADS